VVLEGDRDFLGQGGGAVIGGMAGNTMGGGSGRGLTTAVGAVAGAVAGGMTQEKMTRAQGAEITVRMDSGSTIAVVQEVEDIHEFVAGQRVRLTAGEGKTRVAPLTRQYDAR
jgi:outer membrane lipoprotein SlyB